MDEPSKRPRLWNVPNTLTISRLGMGVLMLAALTYDRYVLALVLFLLASITDALDGYFARLLNQATAFGRQLDPLVDKVLIAGVLVYLVAIPNSGLAPWMAAVIIARELLIQWLRSLLEGQGEAFGAKWSGKLKTVLQCSAIVASLLTLASTPTPGWMTIARDMIVWSAIGLTLYSGIAYVLSARSRLRLDLA
ncbi:MAG: CDP-diacylglycerol--glycerol-3-phosphate 3-phosphatidyltransferase [Isosphaeraceae bacterium]